VLAGKRIVVDPGHGRPDPGAVYHGLYESDVTLAVALELGSLLERAGARPVLTRTTEQSVAGPRARLNDELQARVSLANRAEGDLFISIHANVHSDPTVQGAITFYGPEEGFASGARRTPRLVGQSTQLAAAIQRELVVATGTIDRGVRVANFWVLGGTRMPAVLVEMGFLTSPLEAARLATPDYRRRVAQGILAGVARFLATTDDAQFVADVSIPDGSRLAPGASFVKTWRLRNTGATSWGPEYRFAFHSGDRLGGPDWVPLPVAAASPVPPGGEIDVSVPLVAPADGRATGRWQLISPQGTWFGDRVWVDVQAQTPLPTDRAERIQHPAFTYFAATGHNVGFAFRAFFERYGGLDVFGFPRTEEFEEDGRTVQYFQRARMEYHPEHAGTPYEVQLTLLGDLLTAQRRPYPAAGPFPSQPDHQYFPETGYGVHFAFWQFFRTRGGLEVFGYPISEELSENGRTVQYFQRARLEYHPEHAGTPYEVQLGLLGDEWLRQRGWLR
jgi:N-acetylmuramoyl-L-alanine amidase